MQPSLIVICGATATGKSRLAMTLAQHLNTVILSADSRQVYREFDIGTAKPTWEEQALIPHYLIDICDPTETLTVAEYQEKANHLISSLPHSPPLLVGGTGLYIKAITRGLKIPRVSPHPQLRSSLKRLGQLQLYALLQQVDPNSATKIHPNDQVRTLRALEVFYITGKPISEQQGENPPSYPILQVGLDCSPEVLTERIQYRTEQMLALGFVEEVKGLIKKYGWSLPLLDTLGYQEIKDYLAGETDLKTAKELMVIHTRQFAKRQRTWFKGQSEIKWFDSEQSDLWEAVSKMINIEIERFQK
ncbi:tRNA (adenosine(37)-N6)-dimethylallyltransferase MiaA [Dactylococcopsis salina]|uniref:tRNA dimethylallyltransferase n=1 Tax=Dactylococcopsis salina (strain PCC 8305) TaxID=13035 RepID=K9Z029_DACS8|nr:tRNA (adenosine(37)-N6)-dimethylallyltransferase MiaA [Dactylococcopsis salina]AFZ51703.1 tRNA isopentenyltransferase MiaA [Dactylococcopsis salina PCC 8305]